MKQLPVVWEPLNCLYVHINKTNGKKYFGITSQNPRRRWNEGKGYNKTQIAFYNAIQKYGWDGFYHFVILKSLSRLMACELEKYFISKYKTTDERYGYNITTGGDHPKMSEKTKQKLREISNKKKVICLETNHVYESIREAAKYFNTDISAIRKCCLNNNDNLTCKDFHFMFFEDYKKSSSHEILKILKRQKNYYKKPVICLETKKVYDSITQVNKLFKSNLALIECCKGKNISAGGFHWLYLDEYKQKTKEEIKMILKQETSHDRNKIKIICLETNEIFPSLTDAARILNLNVHSLSLVCNLKYNKNKTINNKHFMYLRDYEKATKNEIQNLLNTKPGIIRKEVVCLNTCTVYKNANQASILLNLSSASISQNCRMNDPNSSVKNYRFQYLQDFTGDKNKLVFQSYLSFSKKRSAQQVVCLNTNRDYPSILQASKCTKCSQNEIRKCCDGKIEQTKGFKWAYKKSLKGDYNE